MKRDWTKVADGFLSDYEKEKEVTKHKTGFSFNLLAEQCGSVVENSHTNYLMRLLQYRAQNRYVFLEDFLALAGFSIQLDTDDIQFETEYFGKSEKGTAGRIDGLIYERKKFAIIIENKINHAGNQKEQIKRYIPSKMFCWCEMALLRAFDNRMIPLRRSSLSMPLLCIQREALNRMAL